MDSLSEIASGLAANPLAWGVTLLSAALVYLWKQLREVQTAYLESVKTSANERREDLHTIIPLADKLADAVETLERLQGRM